MNAFYRPLMTGISNNKKADILDAASLFKADQTYHNYHFLKCQPEKKAIKAQVELLDFSGPPPKTECLCFSPPLSADQLEQALMWGTLWKHPYFLLPGRASDLSPTELRGG